MALTGLLGPGLSSSENLGLPMGRGGFRMRVQEIWTQNTALYRRTQKGAPIYRNNQIQYEVYLPEGPCTKI